MAEPQCHMLPYNQTWLSSSAAVVKVSEVDMLLRSFPASCCYCGHFLSSVRPFGHDVVFFFFFSFF